MNAAIITAGGIGKRFSPDQKKQYIEICGKPLIVWSIDPFFDSAEIDSIFVTAPADSLSYTKKLLDSYFSGKNIVVVRGGKERQDSVFNALNEMGDLFDYVMIHDGVRPLVSSEEITSLLAIAREMKAVIPGHRVKNTIKNVRNGEVVRTIPRDDIYEIYTPQVFDFKLVKACHLRAQQEGVFFTDDAAILEHYGYPVRVLESSPYNIKLTDQIDREFVKLILEERKNKK